MPFEQEEVIIGVISQTGIPGPKGDKGDGSVVSVSATGTSTNEVQYITVDGVESKLAGGKPNYSSLERLGSYLYKISFDNLPEENGTPGVIAGCTSFVRDGKLFRNLDWNYDNAAEFIIECKGFKGMSMVPGLNDGELDESLINQLPYHINDGKNEDGIMVSSHVLVNDFEYSGSGDRSVPLTKLPYLILSNLKSMDDISSLQDYLDNINVNQYLIEAGYVMQFMVTDGVTTYVIVPSEEGYQLIDATENPKMTNFKWVNRALVNRDDEDIQSHPTGIERFNLIDDEVTLEDLRFTLAYESPDRLSEFIGLRDTDKYSTDEELLEIYETAHQMYLERTRDGSLWQTMHSVVYSKNGMDSLNVQENYDINYASANVEIDLSDYATKEFVSGQIDIVENEIATKANQTDLDNAIVAFTDELARKASKASVSLLAEVVDGKQDRLTAGDNIEINNNVISANFAGRSIFVATYNETTYDEILSAYNNGDAVYSTTPSALGGVLLPLARHSGSFFLFGNSYDSELSPASDKEPRVISVCCNQILLLLPNQLSIHWLSHQMLSAFLAHQSSQQNRTHHC